MSMISAQCDELRWLAEIYNRQKKPATSRVFREAADTIGELRDNLQRTNAENAKLREYIERKKVLQDYARLFDDNAKLRELVDGLRYCANESHGHGRCSVRFVDGYVTHCPLYDVDSGTAKCEALMHELGIEVEE